MEKILDQKIKFKGDIFLEYILDNLLNLVSANNRKVFKLHK